MCTQQGRTDVLTILGVLYSGARALFLFPSLRGWHRDNPTELRTRPVPPAADFSSNPYHVSARGGTQGGDTVRVEPQCWSGSRTV